MKRRLLIAIVLLFICGLTACLTFRQSPDNLLFNRAMDAMQAGKYDVARLSLETLINTYPDSEHVSEAKKMLQDPCMTGSGEFMTAGSDCASNPLDH